MKPSLAELDASPIEQYFAEICPHCQHLARKHVMMRDSMGRVSKCFVDGLCRMAPEMAVRFRGENK